MTIQQRTTSFSAQGRLPLLAEMQREPLDLLIIGGGITGAGIALDAASRGLRTGLVEMQDFAAGTSSRSTKLVHGGLRYLKQFEIGVVAEVGKERAIVYENGPHVTTPEWMLLPLYKGGTFGPFSTSIGLRVYDFLAGVKRGERRKMLNGKETLAKEPLLKKDGLRGGGYYVEYRTDDARLTIEVMKQAVEEGALAVNYAKVETLRYENGSIIGAVVHDEVGGGRYDLTAAKVINATGPWVDQVREMDQSKEGKTLRLTKGVHLVFDAGRFPLRQAVYFDTPDGRMVFAIPRAGKTYFGTTDTNYASDIANPQVTAADRTYLLEAVNAMFPGLKLGKEDVESSWAGLRPLIQQEGKSPSEISRRDEIFVSRSGLISIAGGKLTGYRKMAEAVVDKTVALLKAEGKGQKIGVSRTQTMKMSGGDVGGSANFEAYAGQQTVEGIRNGFGEADARFIASRYGSNAGKVFGLAAETKAWADKHGLPLSLAVQLRYAIASEMTVRPVDFFIRRTGTLFFSIAEVRRWKNDVISAMAERLGWTEEQQARYAHELEEKISEASEAVEAPETANA
ncbi:glycerol-3-phosphate dehydrogenase/oxidase [Paenibacillus sacheonensis]|uniref:Glycerol-3-phosphate dehydrogenase n=1 Tax=Paenibacillus sacheonensis TaxID=742054 RepID=A0A7X5C3Z1_9BACL|nr:FAD-dependent oxidoreductase [Paenibacillus sacheonensis]MBM7568159.1 glycerol-3-phosphate dehydrogenase [Paenibacillus sacheonensis]NBC71839.1 FAD-dependent oxidoreductase [Paenibacillus sacheonensis]